MLRHKKIFYYTTFTTDFEDLHGMERLLNLAVHRLMVKGCVFAGEGDWKTAALNRFMKAMAGNKNTGFMEDYTYEMAVGKVAVLQLICLKLI